MKKDLIHNPERLRQTKEFKALQELAYKLNSTSFDPEIFAAGLPYIHHTTQQSFFRLMQACVIFMAEPGNISIDDRNRRSFEACQDIAPIFVDYQFPLI